MKDIMAVIFLISLAVSIFGLWRLSGATRRESDIGIVLVMAGFGVAFVATIFHAIATGQERAEQAIAASVTGPECTQQDGSLWVVTSFLSPDQTVCLMPDGSHRMVRVPAAT